MLITYHFNLRTSCLHSNNLRAWKLAANRQNNANCGNSTPNKSYLHTTLFTLVFFLRRYILMFALSRAPLLLSAGVLTTRVAKRAFTSVTSNKILNSLSTFTEDENLMRESGEPASAAQK
jgi:hypothetical protein